MQHVDFIALLPNKRIFRPAPFSNAHKYKGNGKPKHTNIQM